MKPWLRLTLVVMTVGGGFAGFTYTFEHLQSGFSSHSEPLPNLILMGVFLLLNAGVTLSGLLFVYDSHRTNPLLAALAIQIPWVSSPLIAYRFATGFELLVSLRGSASGEDFALHLAWQFFLGSRWSLTLSPERPYGLGVNVWAFAMLILLWRSIRTALPAVIPRPADETQPDSH